MRPSGKFPSQNFAGFNHNERLVPLVLHVKMCRAVVGMVHADLDAEEKGYDGHRGLRRMKWVRANLYERRFDRNEFLADTNSSP